jgi:RND family efflux transporter MFP subunit
MQASRITRAAICVAILSLPLACGRQETVERPPAVRPVKLLTVGEGEWGGARSYPARVQAANQVDLSFRVGGPLISLPVREGEVVGKGQVLAQIDPRDYEISLSQARAHRERTGADFQRVSALFEKEAVSRAQLDQARAARDVAQAALDDAEAALRDTNLRAPFTARIGATLVENFQDVRPREPVMSLVDVSDVDLVVDLPEGLIAVSDFEVPGRTVVARFDTAPGREFPLQVKEIAAQADPRTQTFRVTLTMPQPEGISILPGMTASVLARGAMTVSDAPPLVPAVAVVADDGGSSHVWLYDEDSRTVSQRTVRLGGLQGSEGIEILEGLERGETIAVSAVSQLREGMEVRPLTESRGF